MKTHIEWLESVAGGDSPNAVATKAEMYAATLAKQIKRGTLPAETVIKISREYGVNPTQALVDTGYLRPDAAKGKVEINNLGAASDHDLALEMLRRIDSGKSLGELWDAPLSDKTLSRRMAKESVAPGKKSRDTKEATIKVEGDLTVKGDLDLNQ